MFNVAAELLRTCHATIAGRYPAAKFDVYFLSSLPLGQAPPVNPEAPDCRALLESPDTTALELTHNYGTENDPSFSYNTGNVEPYRGFGAYRN